MLTDVSADTGESSWGQEVDSDPLQQKGFQATWRVEVVTVRVTGC